MPTKPFSRALKHSLIFTGVLVLIALYLGGMDALERSPRFNFEVVEPGRLLRCAQPRPGDLDRIKAKHGIGAIISLRGREEGEVKEWARDNQVPVVSMQMWADDPPTPGQVGLFFDVMRGDTIYADRYEEVITRRSGKNKKVIREFNLPFPVLLHCEGGSDRTGVLVALYRMAFQGWDVKLAKEDMQGRFHFTSMHPDQFRFLDEVAGKISPTYGSRSPRFDPQPPAPAAPAVAPAVGAGTTAVPAASPAPVAPAVGATGGH